MISNRLIMPTLYTVLMAMLVILFKSVFQFEWSQAYGMVIIAMLATIMGLIIDRERL